MPTYFTTTLYMFDVRVQTIGRFLGVMLKIEMALIIRSRWTGHVSRMDNNGKVSQAVNNNPQGSRLRGRPRNGCWKCVQTDINK
jgi:hypothetical protein